MTQNILLWGFDTDCTLGLPESLLAQGIKVKHWVGTKPQCDINIINLFNLKLDFKAATPIHTQIEDEDIYRFLINYTRDFRVSWQNSFIEMYEAASIYSHYFQGLIAGIDAVVFANIPHEGPDLILYYLAKKAQIKTVIFFQSIFPWRAFCASDFETIGSEFGKEQTYKLAERVDFSPKRPHYMKNKLPTGIGRRFVAGVARGDLHRVLETGSSYLKQREFLRNKAKYTSKILPEKFVYFPLHLQPELETSILGGKYWDQLAAVEDLAAKLPDDYSIVVKENPKQTFKFRSANFFSRIKANPKIHYLGLDYDTFALREKCQFVATITGTAGWESLLIGKKVLVLGLAWYRNLPGAVAMQDFVSVEQFKERIDPKDVIYQADLLLSGAKEALVDIAYLPIAKDFDVGRNVANITAAISEKMH